MWPMVNDMNSDMNSDTARSFLLEEERRTKKYSKYVFVFASLGEKTTSNDCTRPGHVKANCLKNCSNAQLGEKVSLSVSNTEFDPCTFLSIRLLSSMIPLFLRHHHAWLNCTLWDAKWRCETRYKDKTKQRWYALIRIVKGGYTYLNKKKEASLIRIGKERSTIHANNSWGSRFGSISCGSLWYIDCDLASLAMCLCLTLYLLLGLCVWPTWPC